MAEVNNISEQAKKTIDTNESKSTTEPPVKDLSKTLANSHDEDTVTPNGSGGPHEETKANITTSPEPIMNQDKEAKLDAVEKPKERSATPVTTEESVPKVTVEEQESEDQAAERKEPVEKKQPARGRGAPRGRRPGVGRGKAKEGGAGAPNAEAEIEDKLAAKTEKRQQSLSELEKKHETTEDADKAVSPKKPGRKRGAAKEADATTPKVAKSDDGSPQTSPADKKTPLLETPLIIEGKRQRQKVERLDSKILAAPTTHKDTVELPQGSGTKLGDIPFIESLITKTPADDLKPLHRLCFGRPGSNHEVRRHLRTFCGFDFEKGTDGYTKKLKQMDQWGMKQLKKLCETLGLERSGKKEELQAAILDFLVKPHDTGKKVPQSKRKRGASKKRNRSKGGGRSKKAAIGGEASSESDEGDGEKLEKDDDDEKDESETEEPKAKREKKAPPKKKAAPVDASTSKKACSGKTASKAAKKSPPTDDALKTTIKDLLKGANLEEITMRDMCRKVFAKYPEFELASRKDFIKDTVKSLISSSTE